MSFHVRRLQAEKPKRFRKAGRILLTSLAIAKPLLGWYDLWKERYDQRKQKKNRVLFLKRLLLILIAILTAFILLATTVRALVSMDVINVGSITSIAGATLPSDEYGQTNIVLIGQGDDDHDGKYLTDTIIVASFDPENSHSVVLLSLPRDLYFLRSEKMGKGKLNSFYRDYRSYLIYQEGMEEEVASVEALRELGTEIGRKLELDIHHVLKVNFTAFTEAVDAIGGVDVEVPYDIVDTEYPDENYGFQTFEITKGTQHLDGETALKYARSRHTTSDFSRSARQQQILSAMAKKVQEEGLATDTGFISKMAQSLSKNIESTMTLREIIGLADLGRDIERDNIISMQLNDRNALYDGFIEPGGFLYTPPRDQFGGAAVLLPVSIPEFPVTWKQPRTLTHLLFRMRAIYLSPITINVLNSGAQSGAARRLATELIRYGFTVDKIVNADLSDTLETSLIFGRTEEFEGPSDFFGVLLGIESGEAPLELPTNQIQDVTIILGEDYSYQPLQNLYPPQ